MEEKREHGHDVMLKSLDLVRKGKAEQAFNLLDSALQEATEKSRVIWIRMFCRHTAVVAHIAGDCSREIRYTEKALPYVKDYSFAIYNFAQLLLRNGQADLAKRYAAKAYELSTTGGTDADRDLATALLKQWPDIAENR
jgi:hypothetical protein